MIRDLSDFRWPESIKVDSAKWDRSKMCVYHKDHNHTTKQCKSLHYLVERLIKVGHLKQYVRATGGQRETARDLAAQVPTFLAAPRVIINYIHGGLVDEKYNSKRKRQRFLRADSIRERVSSIQHNFLEGSICPVDGIVTFPPVNACQVLQPHKDALILTLGISEFDIRRVLVDLGSSTDLLQMSTYKQMGYLPSALENLERLLFKFNWATTTSQGDVVLPVQAGPITLNVQFSIVEDLSHFNTIMGRAWLHRLKVIPFTYHQMVSYLTKEWHIDLLGSQLAAHQCYQVVLNSGHPTSEEAYPESSNIREQ